MEDKEFNINVVKPLNTEPSANLTRFLKYGMNKDKIDYIARLIKSLFDLSSEEDLVRRNFNQGNHDEALNPRMVHYYIINVGGLPQIVPFAQIDPEKNPSRDARLSPVFIPFKELDSIEDWKLVYDTTEKLNDFDDNTHPVPINWMEKRKEKSVLKMRYWFKPFFSKKDTETLMPKDWEGKFYYDVARDLKE